MTSVIDRDFYFIGWLYHLATQLFWCRSSLPSC